jgi:hypothetical protein
MRKIYAFIATAIVATSLFYVQKNGSEYLFDANVEALAQIENGHPSRGGSHYEQCGYQFPAFNGVILNCSRPVRQCDRDNSEPCIPEICTSHR